MSERPSDDKFAPLNAEEIASSLVEVRVDHEGDVVLPIPHDSPSIPAHPKLGQPSRVWTYRDASGETFFHVCRFETVSGKEIRPLSLWRVNGRLSWLWKGVPEPRPLYNLDKLASRPNATVIVCEGEKASDAAAKVFTNSVCVASANGASGANKAEWKPLARRKVLLWPDADEPGSNYANEVAAILAGLGCDVSIIDAKALASIDPKGGPRDAVVGWDAADAIVDWSDHAKLRKEAYGLAKQNEAKPQFVCWGSFTMDHSGLTTEVTKGRGENATSETLWISSPFEIIGACRDPHGHCWGKWLRWRDDDQRAHTRHVTDAALQGDPAALCAMLANEGLRINRGQQRAFVTYLGGVNVKSRVTIVQRTGWHNIGGNRVFVLPEQTIGPKGSERVILDASAAGPYEARGTLKDWQHGVGERASGHALPVLAISAALAGPLLDLAGQEGGGVSIFGGSSKGKTTVIQAAASVWGRGVMTPGYVRTWRATANGLEGAAASASDTALILDELGVVDARDAAAGIYSLCNGSGKARAARDGALREPKSWLVLILSSGEIPIETKLAEDRGRKARAGQLVRMLDIPADRGLGFGAFDHGGPDDDAGALAKAFKNAAATAYGTAGPEFVRRLIADEVNGDDVRWMVADFGKTHVQAGADGQIDRAAQRFGLIAAAGELAIAMDLVPWRQGEAREAVAWAFAQWIDLRGGTDPAEVRQAIEAVRHFIEQHGDARFEPLDDHDARPVNNRAGWRKGRGSIREWMVPPETWKSEICNGLDATMVARTLAERGMLLRASDGFQPVRKIGGTSKRVYVLTTSIFAGGGDES